MDRREFLKTCAIGTGVSLAPGYLLGGSADKEKRKPNIILINADDIGAYDFGCYGGSEFKTPNIDKLAETGVQFGIAYATGLCAPSRCMLHTGRYATQTGIWYNNPKLNDREKRRRSFPSMEQVMKQSGYVMAVAGKWEGCRGIAAKPFDESCIWPRQLRYLAEADRPDADGKEAEIERLRYWRPLIVKNGRRIKTTAEDYGPDIMCGFLIDFMVRHKNDLFFVYYPMVLPHGESGAKHSGVPLAMAPPTPDPLNPGKRREPGIKGMKEYIDVLVGRIIGALDKNALREDTIVIFTSDNGSYGRRGKGKAYEAGVWVPLVVNCPGRVKALRQVHELASFVDILPTMCELSGAPVPEGIDGISFAPVLQGKPGKRKWLFSYVGKKRIMRDKRWLWENHSAEKPGRFYDCGGAIKGTSKEKASPYKDVTESNAPEVVAARARFAKILKTLCAPKVVLAER